MKIVRLIQEFPKEITGGLVPNVYYISKEQVKQGHKVWVFAFTKDKPSQETFNGIKVCRIKKPPLIRWFGGLFFIVNIKKLGINPDIIHGIQPISFGWLFPVAKLLIKTKYALSIHCSIYPLKQGYISGYKNIMYNFEFSKLCKFLAKKVDLIIPVAKFIKDELKSIKISEKKIRVIPSGVNLNLFYRDKEDILNKTFKNNDYPFIILYIGRLAQIKGVKYLIEAFNILKNKYKLQLLLIGGRKSDNSFSEIKELINRYNLNKLVKIIPPVSQKELINYYRKASVFVLPSIHEPQAKVIHESMASSLPIIATNSGGNPEIIKDMINGLLISPKDSSAIAIAIERVRKDKVLKNKLIKNAHETVRGYDWEIIANKYSHTLHSIIDKN